ncbi:MAG TPA: insulinase family protein, partial [Azospirillaceae bacterium]|nr:insulinase family protein [Azospirillaceae bacterium]
MRRITALFIAVLFVAVAWRPAQAVEIKRTVSPGGIEIWHVEDVKIPVIALSWSFKEAGAVPLKGKEGLAYLAAGTMDEGAGDLDAQAFRARLADIAARLSFQAGREGFS